VALGWYYQRRGAEIGPVSSAQLRQLAAAGKVSRDTLVRKESCEDWVLAGRVKGLFGATEQAPGSSTRMQASSPTKPKTESATCARCSAKFSFSRTDGQGAQFGLCPRCSAQAAATGMSPNRNHAEPGVSPVPDLRSCPYCQRLVSRNASTCSYCAKSIVGPLPIVIEQASPDWACSNVTKPAHARSMGIMILCVALMMTCVFAPFGLLILWLHRRQVEETLRRSLEEGLQRTRSCGLQPPTAQQTGRILELALQHLTKPMQDLCQWQVGNRIPPGELWRASEALVGVVKLTNERPIALGGPGRQWFLITSWALYYSGREVRSEKGACALSNIASVLAQAGDRICFTRRDGTYGYFSCEDFLGRQKDLVAFLDAIPFIFDPPGSVVLELPSERLTATAKGRAIVAPNRCSGCGATSVAGSVTLTWDGTVVVSDDANGNVGSLTEFAGNATVTVVSKGAECVLPGVPVVPEIAGALAGGVAQAMIDKVSSHMRRRRGKRDSLSLRLPCCSGCLARSVGRIHGIGSSTVMLVLYNRHFAAELKSLNGL